MRKRFLILSVLTAVFALFLLGNTAVARAECTEVYLGGMAAGFRIDNKGATVIGVNDVISGDGIYSPSRDAGFKAGDVITSLGGKEVNTAADIEKILASYDGKGTSAVIEREGEVLVKIVYPAKDIAGKYKMGLFIRDDISGIGTVTYIKDDLTFGALGHPIVDGEIQKIVKINSGVAYRCNIIGVRKGERGKAGEIRGYFMEDDEIGKVCANKAEGLFGKITDESFVKGLRKVEVGEARPGKASIYSTIEGTTPGEYSVSIVKYDDDAPENKNLVLKITDEKLLSKTAGILQGMSGSPVLQNGKIVGAVTHVFLNDPTRGFGIGIQNMLGN